MKDKRRNIPEDSLSDSEWLRLPYIDSNALTWWQEFAIFKEFSDRKTYINIGKPSVQLQKIYECPLVEAKRYQNLLKDPLINNQSDISKRPWNN